MGALLYFIATLLGTLLRIPLLFIGTIISLFKHEGNLYYKNIAIGKDHFDNVLIAPIANLLLIKKSSAHRFGNIQESISGVLGKNFEDSTCTKFGLLWCNDLDKIQKNHVEISIDRTVK
jgi:hypothetical protein